MNFSKTPHRSPRSPDPPDPPDPPPDLAVPQAARDLGDRRDPTPGRGGEGSCCWGTPKGNENESFMPECYSELSRPGLGEVQQENFL